jgi:hypothetical protein
MEIRKNLTEYRNLYFGIQTFEKIFLKNQAGESFKIILSR